jgi:hypothetical protein
MGKGHSQSWAQDIIRSFGAGTSGSLLVSLEVTEEKATTISEWSERIEFYCSGCGMPVPQDQWEEFLTPIDDHGAATVDCVCGQTLQVLSCFVMKRRAASDASI